MSLKGQMGKAVMKRIEAMPSVQAGLERSERVRPALRAAMDAAYGSLEDDAAKVKLAERLGDEPDVLKEATIELARNRDDYVRDRAYRLLSAAAGGTAVQSIPPERRELFGAEEAIGRIPIEEAFGRLAEMEPRLLDVKRQAQSRDGGENEGECGLKKDVREMLHGLVGGGAEEGHELLRTSLATSVVHQYLQQLAGNTRLGSPGVAYFDSPIKQFVATHVLFGRRRPAPSRP